MRPPRPDRLARVLLVVLGLAVLVGTGARLSPDATPPLPHAHAHNDYLHQRPLLEALEHGFCSIEADVFLVDGRLLVGHEADELSPERTLEALYLGPLRERVRAGGGRVYEDGPALWLLVDIKSEAGPTYAALHGLLGRYPDLVGAAGGAADATPVRVILSGNRRREAMLEQKGRLAAFDGRLADLDADDAAAFMPLISDSWPRHFSWRGEGPMPEEERAKLREIVAAAHAKGRRVRFWATPERAEVWEELLDAGVDLIGTDELGRLAGFLRERSTRESRPG